MSMTDLSLCGWRVRSAVHLPELPLWSGDDRAPDITVQLGDVPTDIGPISHRSPFLSVAKNGVCRFEIAAVAAYLIEDGRLITIAPRLDLSQPDMRVFLFGTVLGILCYQRGVLPLHASCVSVNGRAIAIAGVSGAGKSTLALALSRRGHPILADDISAVDWKGASGPHILPSIPRLRLWRDAMDRFAISPEGLERSRPGMEKYHLDHGSAFQPTATPLAAIYCLNEARPPVSPGIRPLTGTHAIAQLASNIYRRRPATHMGLAKTLFEATTRIATSTKIWALDRPIDLARIDALAESVEHHILLAELP